MAENDVTNTHLHGRYPTNLFSNVNITRMHKQHTHTSIPAMSLLHVVFQYKAAAIKCTWDIMW